MKQVPNTRPRQPAHPTGRARPGRMRRMLTACGVSAALVWPGAALAADAVQTVIDLVAQERYTEARAKLDPLLRDDPDEPRVRLMHGILRAREGRPGDAIEVFEDLRDDHPAMFEPYNNLAVLYADQNRLDAARQALIAALERKPDAVVYANLGDVYTRLARAAYTSARELRQGGDSGKKSESTAAIPMPSSKPTPAENAAKEAAPGSSAQAEPSAAPPFDSTVPVRPERLAAPRLEPGTTGQSKPVATAALSGECVRAGQFKDRASATEAAEWMQAQGAEIVGIGQRDRRVASRHWVHLPALSSRAEATRTVAELRAKGVRDIAISRKGSQPNVISLGVFGDAGNKDRRVAQIEKLGYTVMVSTSDKTVPGYVVRARAGAARASFDGPWAARFPGHSIRYVDCAATG